MVEMLAGVLVDCCILSVLTALWSPHTHTAELGIFASAIFVLGLGNCHNSILLILSWVEKGNITA
eukprot:11837888-Ditylum_brightwellii.AAC.1